MSLPNFSTIERFLTVGGGKANDIYDRMMSSAFPKSTDPPLNIMNELKNKALTNLYSIRSIFGFIGLYGFHDNIFKQKYKGASDLIFWRNSSFNLHDIINLPISIDELLRIGDGRAFNFFESMYPMNIKIEAENGLTAAFQFWNLPNVISRLDEVMVDLLYSLTDFDVNPESTANVNDIRVITMLKAICNVQKTILEVDKNKNEMTSSHLNSKKFFGNCLFHQNIV